MTGAERGFLLLTSRLGNPDRKVLTVPQLRMLTQRMKDFDLDDPNRDLTLADLTALGYGQPLAERILGLLSQEDVLDHYLRRGEKLGCKPLTRVSPEYPAALKSRLGAEAPGCLWVRGDVSLLNTPMIAMVGSRDLNPINGEFAREAGRQAAIQSYTLVSGNARGVDQTTQRAALATGGQVISIVADELWKHTPREGVLYLSEDCFDEPFSAQRALSRNRCIHAMGEKTLVAQCSFQHGGTWDGTVKNLRFSWSPVFCFEDGSPAARLLKQMGANPVAVEQLSDLNALAPSEYNFLGR